MKTNMDVLRKFMDPIKSRLLCKVTSAFSAKNF